MLPTVAFIINIMLTEPMLVDLPAVKGPLAPLRTELESLPPAINVVTEEETMVTETGKVTGAL